MRKEGRKEGRKERKKERMNNVEIKRVDFHGCVEL
jgi:hypothetical protein